MKAGSCVLAIDGADYRNKNERQLFPSDVDRRDHVWPRGDEHGSTVNGGDWSIRPMTG